MVYYGRMLPATDPLRGLTALVPAPPGAAIAGADGMARRVELETARSIFQSGEALVAHAAFVAGRLKAPSTKPLFDVLELFAFLRPGQPFIPSALGLARILGLDLPQTPEAQAASLFAIAACLLKEIVALPGQERDKLAPLIGTLARAGWRWAPLLQTAIAVESPHGSPIAGLEAWRALPVWEDEAPAGTPGSQAVEPDEARARLTSLVGTPRAEQAAYSDAATYAFGPREDSGAPRIAR